MNNAYLMNDEEKKRLENIINTKTNLFIAICSPTEAYNIMLGKATLLISDSVPKDYTGWCYCYVVEKAPYLGYGHTFGDLRSVSKEEFDEMVIINKEQPDSYSNECREFDLDSVLNGLVPFRFWLDEYDEVQGCHLINQGVYWYMIGDDGIDFYKKLGITVEDVKNNLGLNDGYALYIKKLEIFKEALRLEDL